MIPYSAVRHSPGQSDTGYSFDGKLNIDKCIVVEGHLFEYFYVASAHKNM